MMSINVGRFQTQNQIQKRMPKVGMIFALFISRINSFRPTDAYMSQ